MDKQLSQLWTTYQPSLFPDQDNQPNETSEGHRRLILTIDDLSPFIFKLLNQMPEKTRGRPKECRLSFVLCMLGMRVLNICETKAFIDRLKVDAVLRRICRFPARNKIPCEATFSNVYAELAKFGFAEKLQEMHIKCRLEKDLVQNVSRDSTAISAREKVVPKPKEKMFKKKEARATQKR